MADWGYPEINDSVILTPQNHDQFIRDYEEALIYYHLPNCKYCVIINKFFSELSLEWKERDPRVPFAKFNCSKHIEYCENLAIPVFPFIKFYIRGHPIPYYGKRLKYNLNKFVEDIMKKEPIEINFEKIIDKNFHKETFLVYFGNKNTKTYHYYDLNSKYHLEKEFYFVNKYDVDQLEKWSVFKDHHFHQTDFQNAIFIFSDGDVHLFDKTFNFDNIDSFIHKVTHPDVLELGYSFQQAYETDPAVFFILFVRDRKDQNIIEFEKFARDHKKQMNFLVASEDTYHTKQFQLLKQVLFLEEDDFPCVRIISTSFQIQNALKYKIPGELSYEYYYMFLRAFQNREIQPYLKSQNLLQQEINGIRLLNANTYQQEVYVSGQDSVILYHKDFDRDEKSKKFLEILSKIKSKDQFANLKYFAINAEENELVHFYHDQPPLLILHSKKDLLNPIYYFKEPSYKQVKRFIKSKRDIVKKENMAEFFNEL